MILDMNKYEGVLFDLDGTLVDSMDVWKEVVKAIYDANGIDSDVNGDMKKYHAMKVSEVFVHIHKKWNTPMDEVGMKKLADSILLDAYTNRILEVKGAVGFVKRCKKDGKRMAVVTSSPMVLVKPVLQRLGIYDDFITIESAEDQRLSKHDPQIFEQALKAIDVPTSKTIFFEDSRYALETADRLGITAIGMKTKAEPYIDREAIGNFDEVR
ncbi:HAD hydrolase, family IA [Firmicutes bacterium M10-2]|nr:HAD hydrolase, family IA [Firmicutes bacterium M10-2]